MYEQEFLTAGLTILGGIIVYVSGQLLVKLHIEPIISLKEEIGRIASLLVYYADVYSDPKVPIVDSLKERYRKASDDFRVRASELRAKGNAATLICLLGFSNKKQIYEAANMLIFISNSILQGKGTENVSTGNRIEELLRIAKKNK